MTFSYRTALPIALVLGAAQVALAQEEAGAAGDESVSADIAGAAEDVSGGGVHVATEAGAGGDLLYADPTVVELGGLIAFTHASETTIFRISPIIGYFVARGVELTLFPEFSIFDVSGETDVQFGLLLEPSYHLGFSERFFGFVGIGVGLRYAEDPGVDFALRPKVGVDIMVGRSGIFKPALFLDIGANDGVSQGGFEAAFTVML